MYRPCTCNSRSVDMRTDEVEHYIDCAKFSDRALFEHLLDETRYRFRAALDRLARR